MRIDMRHKKKKLNFNKTQAHRNAMFRNLATSVIERKKVVTTLAKAKAIRPIVEKMITLGKKVNEFKDDPHKSLHYKRQVFSYLKTRNSATMLFNEIAPKFQEKSGGYTRIVKLGFRKGDGAPKALIEIIEE